MKLQTLKNKYALAYPLLALGLVLGSCSQEEGDNALPENVSQNKTITFTVNSVTAETKDISTRVTVESSGRFGDALKWEDNDKVSFFYFNSEFTHGQTIPFTVSVDGSTPSITGGFPTKADDYNIRALYPHNASNFLNDETYLTIPDPQVYDADLNYLRNVIFMYAQPNTTVNVDSEENATGGDIELDFDILNTLLRFDIMNNSSSEVYLQKIDIRFPDGAGAKLASRVLLNEEQGTVSLVDNVNSVHTVQSLLFNDQLLNGNNVGIQPFMSIFPTDAATSLHVDLTLKFSDQTTKTLLYKIDDIEPLVAGSRYSINLTIYDDDVPSIIPGTIYDNFIYTRPDYFSDLTSACINPDGAAFVRASMITPSICPAGWSLFAFNELNAISPNVRYALLSAIQYPYGYYDEYYSNFVEIHSAFVPNPSADMMLRVASDGVLSSYSSLPPTRYLPVFCRRAI